MPPAPSAACRVRRRRTISRLSSFSNFWMTTQGRPSQSLERMPLVRPACFRAFAGYDRLKYYPSLGEGNTPYPNSRPLGQVRNQACKFIHLATDIKRLELFFGGPFVVVAIQARKDPASRSRELACCPDLLCLEPRLEAEWGYSPKNRHDSHHCGNRANCSPEHLRTDERWYAHGFVQASNSYFKRPG